MNKILLSALSLFISVNGLAVGVKKSPMALQASARVASAPAALTMTNVLTTIYDESQGTIPNYYVILSNNPNAKYNANTGDITAPDGSFTMIVDLYNYAPEDGKYLPGGTYTVFSESEQARPLSYSHEYSMLNYYDPAQGQVSYQFTEPIDIEYKGNDQYEISTVYKFGDGSELSLHYAGPLTFGTSTEKPTVYPQITHNIKADLNKGGISFYQGVTDISSQGVSFLDLYNVKFDESNGYMESAGYNLSMMIAHKRFTKRADYAVCPGEYTNANNLARDTWYPAREIDYMGITMPLGSYIRELKIENGQRSYTYAYLKTGKFTIVDNGDGTYSGTLDAITTLGYTVELTWSGPITLNTENATFTSTVSDLTDDVEMDFSPLDKGRIYHTGIVGGCRTFIVDLGSPSGKDEAINNGGDLLRMEFLSPTSDNVLKPGLYTVVTRRWNSNELQAGGTYEPMSLNKGYFGAQGDQIGTRYAHFRTGSWCVYDMVGPAEEGTVRVSTTDYKNYTFDIDLIDDAGFKMTGYWDNKPLEYFYDPESIFSGIENVAGDDIAVKVVKEGDSIIVANAGDAPVQIFSVDGRCLVSACADAPIRVAELGKGIFIVKVSNKSIKITL